MDIIIYSFNLNISPKVSYGMLECDIVTELHAYSFVIKYFVIKMGCCAKKCIKINLNGLTNVKSGTIKRIKENRRKAPGQ